MVHANSDQARTVFDGRRLLQGARNQFAAQAEQPDADSEGCLGGTMFVIESPVDIRMLLITLARGLGPTAVVLSRLVNTSCGFHQVKVKEQPRSIASPETSANLTFDHAPQ
jgi:hypothetical protein